jgi:hypothetical protein
VDAVVVRAVVRLIAAKATIKNNALFLITEHLLHGSDASPAGQRHPFEQLHS